MALWCYIYQKKEINSTIQHDPRIIASIIMISLLALFIPVERIFPISEAKMSNPILVSEDVKGISVSSSEISPTTSPTVTFIPSPTPTILSTATSTPRPVAAKKSYKIAVYGDSMVDTMGERLEYLEHALKRRYPGVDFTLYNFGKGAENVEMGISRFEASLRYQDRDYPPLHEIRPDILIVGSFGYNPFTPYDRNHHWLGLTKLVEKAKTLSPKVYMLAEIAPLRRDFGKGSQGVNWSDQTNIEHSGHIIEQLQNAVALSKNLGVPLIDAFGRTFSGYEGKKEYVNPSDGIHPSVAGHEFTAETIADTIKLD